MGSRVPTEVPEHKGKSHTKPPMKKCGVLTDMPYHRRRHYEDDSHAVNMSDQSLGGGIRQTGSKK